MRIQDWRSIEIPAAAKEELVTHVDVISISKLGGYRKDEEEKVIKAKKINKIKRKMIRSNQIYSYRGYRLQQQGINFSFLVQARGPHRGFGKLWEDGAVCLQAVSSFWHLVSCFSWTVETIYRRLGIYSYGTF